MTNKESNKISGIQMALAVPEIMANDKIRSSYYQVNVYIKFLENNLISRSE